MAKSKLNTLFRKTEPDITDIDTPADPVSILEATPIPAPIQETKTKRKPTVTPHSVYISKEDYEIIKAIAAAYNEKPHAVIQYAVKEVIRKWKRTKKLKTNEDGKLRK